MLYRFRILQGREQQEDGPRVPRFEEEGGDGIYTARRYRVRGYDRARGWGYYKEAPVTGSMTTAGVASVAICVHELEGKGWKLDAKAKQSVRDGIAWLGESFSVSQNPGGRDAGTGPGSMYHYYYLYGLERAGVLARVVHMGEHRWYAEGARYLVDGQDPDGAWRPYDLNRPGPGLRREGRKEGWAEGAWDPVDQSFALLFLLRSTARSFGVVTERRLVDLSEGHDLPERAHADLFRAAFAEMDRLTEAEAEDRATDFAFLGPRVIGLLLPKLYSEEGRDRAKAVLILRAATGLEHGYDANAAAAARETAADRWTSWYLENRTRLALDRAARRIR
jgi:hypothetical protein